MASYRFIIMTTAFSILAASPSHAGFLFFKTPAQISADRAENLTQLKALRKKEKIALKNKSKQLTKDEIKQLALLEKKEKKLKQAEVKAKEKLKKLEEEDKFQDPKPSKTVMSLFSRGKQAEYEPIKIISSIDTVRFDNDVLNKKSVVLLGDIPKSSKTVEQKSARKSKKWTIDEKFEPQTVAYSGEKPGTIIIDSKKKFLYFVDTPLTARRYGVAVGKEGLAFKGTVVVDRKAEWPRWIPTAEMIARSPDKYKKYEDGMDGGPDNPLGARAIYLTDPASGKDTYLRIHGTTQPWTIGTAASNGCFRMVNEHVMELFEKVPVGTTVKVI
jgi:lipoprotein-anchoring transpeptidase ErfK/SrfK